MGRFDYASIDLATATTDAGARRDEERMKKRKANSRPATRSSSYKTDISLEELDVFAEKIQLRYRDRAVVCFARTNGAARISWGGRRCGKIETTWNLYRWAK